MPSITCINCGAYCCTCAGCNTKAYKDGLCPKCQQEIKEKNVSNTSDKSVQQLPEYQDSNRGA